MIDLLRRYQILPVASVDTVEIGLRLCETLLEAELPILEIDFHTSAAEMAIKAIRERFPKFTVGAGHLLSAREVAHASFVGACFGRAGGCREELLQAAASEGLVFIPGVATPTDIETALAAQAKTMTFFPATRAGGPALLRLLAATYGPLGASFIAGGGITADNLKSYLEIDRVIAVDGTWMVAPRYLRKNDWTSVFELSREARYKASH